MAPRLSRGALPARHVGRGGRPLRHVRDGDHVGSVRRLSHARSWRPLAARSREVCGLPLDGAGSPRLSCRFTHVYPDGPAPYYTVLCPAKRGGEVEQWDEIKAAVSETVIEAAGRSPTTTPSAATIAPGTTASAPIRSPRRFAAPSGRDPWRSTRASSILNRRRSLVGYALTFPAWRRSPRSGPPLRPAEPSGLPGGRLPVALLVAMRPSEWIKNLLVFAGLLFSQKLRQGPQVVDAIAHLRARSARSRAPATCSTTCTTLLSTAASREAPPSDRQRRAVDAARPPSSPRSSWRRVAIGVAALPSSRRRSPGWSRATA